MKAIDDKGRIFGKINVIDFLVIVIVLVLIPGFYVGQKLMREFYKGTELYHWSDDATFYVVKRDCPNCGNPISVEIGKGKLAAGTFPYKTTCPNCEFEVILKFQDEK